jgi:Holliday junction resolvasome RuvABC endonuclease subunit
MAKKQATLQQPFFLLSIDPAKAAGFAFFIAGRLTEYGEADGSRWKTLHEKLQPLERFKTDDWLLAECVIEEAFPTFGRQNFKSTCTLGRRRGLAQAAAESIGIDKFSFVQPSTWQNALGWRRGQDTKVWSLGLVKTRYGVDNISDDTSDAINLGQWFLDSRQALA